MRDRTRLVFGTAALGLPYGLPREGGARTLMDDTAAAALLAASVSSGILTFDTAPAYGVAEERLGAHLGERGVVWTKVKAGGSLSSSIDVSIRRLRRSTLDLVQWHNWTEEEFRDDALARAWAAMRVDPRVASVGASTYGTTHARAAIKSGLFDVVQIEWNVLNQSVLRDVADDARRRKVKLALRSVYLQGALTNEGRKLPPLETLVRGVERARQVARSLGVPLEHLALRAALDQLAADWVLLGFDRVEQLAVATAIADSPRLERDIADLDLGGDSSVDPRTWPNE